MSFYLTLAPRFTGLRIKQASRKSTTGHRRLIKPECVKERQAKREREAEKVMVSPSLSLALISSLRFLLAHIYMRERKRGGEHKDSARKVYNALKPASHSLLYIKPVNSRGNVPTVLWTHQPHSPPAQGRKWQRRITRAYRQTVSGSTSASLDYCHPFCVTHAHTPLPSHFSLPLTFWVLRISNILSSGCHVFKIENQAKLSSLKSTDHCDIWKS